MIAILSLLIVLTLSLLITRIASSALVLTGLSKEVARFQARSALSGTGFTTSEAEQVVGHPVRRRIILFLILMQNAGLVTAISALVLSFINTENSAQVVQRAAFLAIGAGVPLLIANRKWKSRTVKRQHTRLNKTEKTPPGRINPRTIVPSRVRLAVPLKVAGSNG